MYTTITQQATQNTSGDVYQISPIGHEAFSEEQSTLSWPSSSVYTNALYTYFCSGRTVLLWWSFDYIDLY